MCTVKYSLSLSLTVSFSLPLFSIVGRQMAASVTRKGVFDHTEGWIHYEGYEWWWWWWWWKAGKRGVAGACQICRLLLRLIWRGAQKMIKAQVKSLIELSFKLISLLPLPAKALNPPPCSPRCGVSAPTQLIQWVSHSGRQNNMVLISTHIDTPYVVFNKCCIENEGWKAHYFAWLVVTV